MVFLSLNDARQKLSTLLDANLLPRRGEPGMKCGLFYFGDEVLANAFWIALRLIEGVGPWEEAWLWLHKPDTYKRYGLHLYNRLRLSYGEHRLIDDAPVHHFHGYEHADLCSFLAVALLNEWSFYLVTSQDYGRLYVSQSSGAELWVHEPEALERLGAELQAHNITMSVRSFDASQ